MGPPVCRRQEYHEPPIQYKSYLKSALALAANGESRSLARGAPALPGIRFILWGVATFSGRVFPGLAAIGSKAHTRLAAKHVKAGRRYARRLDFRGLSSKTAPAAARDTCE